MNSTPSRPDKPMEYVALLGEVIKTTAKAVLVDREGVYGHKKEMWIPRSQIQYGDGINIGFRAVMISTWFAEKEGIIKKEIRHAKR